MPTQFDKFTQRDVLKSSVCLKTALQDCRGNNSTARIDDPRNQAGRIIEIAQTRQVLQEICQSDRHTWLKQIFLYSAGKEKLSEPA